MNPPVVLMVLTLTALLWSQSGIASNVGSPAYRPDGRSVNLVGPVSEEPGRVRRQFERKQNQASTQQ